MRNEGKIFENEFKKSVPEGVYCLRLHDAAIGFDIEKSAQRFAPKSPYDFIICKNGMLYAFELKSNNGTSLSFDGKTPRIKRQQIEELLKVEKSGAVAGIIINFRKYEKTFFIWAHVFWDFMNYVSKKSISYSDAKKIGILVPQRKLKVHYCFDLDSILNLENDIVKGIRTVYNQNG